MRLVVANDEDDMARPAGVVAHQPSEIDPRDSIRWDRPRRRIGPVAAVDQPNRRLEDAVRLTLRERRRREDRSYEPGSEPSVPAEPIDVEAVARRVRLDLEANRLAIGHAERRRVSLNRRIAAALDIPLRFGGACQLVLADDRTRAARADRAGARALGAREEGGRAHDRQHGKSSRDARVSNVDFSVFLSSLSSRRSSPNNYASWGCL